MKVFSVSDPHPAHMPAVFIRSFYADERRPHRSDSRVLRRTILHDRWWSTDTRANKGRGRMCSCTACDLPRRTAHLRFAKRSKNLNTVLNSNWNASDLSVFRVTRDACCFFILSFGFKSGRGIPHDYVLRDKIRYNDVDVIAVRSIPIKRHVLKARWLYLS